MKSSAHILRVDKFKIVLLITFFYKVTFSKYLSLVHVTSYNLNKLSCIYFIYDRQLLNHVSIELLHTVIDVIDKVINIGPKYGEINVIKSNQGDQIN